MAYLFLSVGEQFADILLRGADILVQNLRTVHNLRLASVQHFTDLSGHKRLSGTRWTKEEDTLALYQ
jgi:hypothetical protein